MTINTMTPSTLILFYYCNLEKHRQSEVHAERNNVTKSMKKKLTHPKISVNFQPQPLPISRSGLVRLLQAICKDLGSSRTYD